MIHASNFKPRVFPYNGDVSDAEIDRAQSIDPDITLNREEVKEIGRDGVVGYLKRTPTVPYNLTQYEYGNFEFWRKLTNQADSVLSVDLNDFKTSMVDICGYLTDDDDVFLGTVQYPKLRTAGFSWTIGDPDAVIERSFSLIGEDAIIWQGANKYFILNEKTMGSAETGSIAIDLSARPPVLDPDLPAGDDSDYFIRILRVRAGVTSELALTTNYTYVTGTSTLTILGSLVGDVIKTYYTSGTAPATIFTDNDVDPAGIMADCVTIELTAGDRLYRLQDVTIDVAFDRADYKEIGNTEVVQRGITDKTVTVSLGRFLEDFSIEEALRGVSADYGKINPREFADNLSISVKIYTDNTKTTFAYGFLVDGLSPTSLRGGASVDEYSRRENTLEGNTLLISTTIADLN